MTFTVHNLPPKTCFKTAIVKPACIRLMTGDYKLKTIFMAATCTNCTAVASAEPSAAIVSFQR